MIQAGACTVGARARRCSRPSSWRSKGDVVAVVAHPAIADAGAIDGEGVVEVTTCGDDAVGRNGDGFERARGSLGAVEHLGVRRDERLDEDVRGGFEKGYRGELGVDQEVDDG